MFHVMRGLRKPAVHEDIGDIHVFLKSGLHVALANRAVDPPKEQQSFSYVRISIIPSTIRAIVTIAPVGRTRTPRHHGVEGNLAIDKRQEKRTALWPKR